jgi:para-aminobenzoate synthetase/4-amino-4-deoxychorismate lyase
VLVQAEALAQRILDKRAGVRARVMPVPRSLPELKTVAWLGPRLALDQADADEEPLRCVGGQGLEGATTNVFCSTPEGVITPPADGRILPGTARAVLMTVLDQLGVPCRAAPLPLSTLARYGGVVTNALLRLAPIRTVDEQAVPVPTWVMAATEVFDAVAG